MDYSLLRPFDPVKAKAGEPICCPINGRLEPRKFIGGPDSRGWICIEYPNGHYDVCIPDQYRMSPLCWVEAKPVYKGDTLYDSQGKKVVKAADGLKGWLRSEDGITFKAGGCTWTPPKVKKEGWVNIYAHKVISHLYLTREIADKNRALGRIDCVKIEWEE